MDDNLKTKLLNEKIRLEKERDDLLKAREEGFPLAICYDIAADDLVELGGKIKLITKIIGW